MISNSTHSFMGFMQGAFSGLFGARHGGSVPPFMSERVLRDIGLLEPEERMAHQRGEDLVDLASKNSVLSIGLTGL